MDNIIILPATDYEADKKKIEDTWQNNPVYVLDNEKTYLHQYLDYLYDECKLKVKILYRMHICKQQKFDSGSVTLILRGEQHRPKSMVELLGMLDKGEACSIVIETDDRVLLANILQQLIYIDYPTTLVNMKLRKEYKDAEKTKRFMDRLDELQTFAEKAANLIRELYISTDETNAEEFFDIRKKAIDAYSKIGEQIRKARDVEMKVAVAASKKTGKSVIVNSMLGMELAPTSYELATPNNCIYRKSSDNSFHLEYKGKTEDFAEARDLHQRINREFKGAEKNAADGFTIADMTISYIGEGNNFESYTIYDTPGPDAKGTRHSEAAEAAMGLCDVAVFAIDYSKYLTDTEVEYLESVKNIFEKDQKFHSLIFVINKLDLALTDKGSKSRVKSIDFIRKRLRDIDEHYGDCVIFATSAQDYFYTVEMEHAAREGERFAPQLRLLTQPGANLRTGLDDLLEEYDEEDMDEDLRTVLSNLEAETGKVRNQLGYKNPSLKDMQDYSGMPQLMSHIAYVAQSKAREEIVNGITFAIDQQQKSLQEIINRVANLESLMNANEEQIQRIKEIMEGFQQEIEPLLRPAVTKEETEANFNRQKSGLGANVRTIGEKKGYPVQLKDALKTLGGDIKGAVSELAIQDGIWGEYSSAQRKKIKDSVGQKCTSAQLEKKLSLSREEFGKLVTNYLGDTLQEEKESVDKDAADARDSLQEILRARMEKLRIATEECQKQLDKTGVALELPTLPEFDCAISLPTFSTSSEFEVFISMKSESTVLFHEYWRLPNFFYNLFHWSESSFSDRNGYIRELSDQEIHKAVENMYLTFYNAIKEAGIYKHFKAKLAELAENVDGLREELDKNFETITETCHGNIDAFMQLIDGRDKFREENEMLARMKQLICEIQNASADFLSVWHAIIS